MDKSKTNKSNVNVTAHLASISYRCAEVLDIGLKGVPNFRSETYSNDP
jgi:hypothetical protein